MFKMFSNATSAHPTKALTPVEHAEIRKMFLEVVPSILTSGEDLKKITPYLSKEIDQVLTAKIQIETHIDSIASTYIDIIDALKLSILNHTATKTFLKDRLERAKNTLEMSVGLHQDTTQSLFELIENSRLNPHDCTNAMTEQWHTQADETKSAMSPSF